MKSETLKPIKNPVAFLREHYLEKRKKKPSYSISAFARDLGISTSFLSRLLRGDRPLTVKQAIQISVVLGMSTQETDLLVANIVSNSAKNAKISVKFREEVMKKNRTHTVYHYEVERFKAISTWYHMAILSLSHTQTFKAEPTWIAKRIGITSVEAKDALERLLDLGLLEKKANQVSQTDQSVFIKTKKSEPAVREFHLQMIEKSRQSLLNPSDDAYENRYIAGSTLAIDKSLLPLLKKRLEEVQLEIAELSRAKKYTDVYQFNLQLFPLTQTNET